MNKTRDYFERAGAAYDRAVELIRQLDGAYQARAFGGDPARRYDTKVTLHQFDVILQAILLQQSLADGRFDRLERRFVDRITDYGDLPEHLLGIGGPDISWSRIAHLEPQLREELTRSLPQVLSDLCDSFVLPLAIVDRAVESIDFLGKLEGCITEIAGCLSFVDGQRETREATACAAAVVEMIEARWRSIKEG